jgi:hypothetical protein
MFKENPINFPYPELSHFQSELKNACVSGLQKGTTEPHRRNNITSYYVSSCVAHR